MGHIEADHEIQFDILAAEALRQCGQGGIAELIEVHELLLIQPHLGRPVLDERIGFGIGVEVVAQSFNEGGLTYF